MTVRHCADDRLAASSDRQSLPQSAPRTEIEGDDCLIVSLIPALRAFARTLHKNPDRADDLVQDTLTKAIANIDKFEPGTRMKSWLFTIMRNSFYSQYRKLRHEAFGWSEDAALMPRVPAPQNWVIQRHEMKVAIERLPPQQREVLVLIGVLGVTYDEAADICGCAMGTVKSRLNRARENLLKHLGEDSAGSLLRHDEDGPGNTS